MYKHCLLLGFNNQGVYHEIYRTISGWPIANTSRKSRMPWTTCLASLYLGVFSENPIVGHHDGKVTLSKAKPGESKTGATRIRTLKGEDFLWLVLQHVLPKGFRRAREYDFLHENAKRLLSLVQRILRVVIAVRSPRPRPVFT